jgi:putative ABC transport system permease protein
MMIMLYVAHEMSYDRFHKDAGRIFKPYASLKMGGNSLNMENFSWVSGPMIKQSQPTVDAFIRTLRYSGQAIVWVPGSGSAKFAEDDMLFADRNFFDFFSFKLLSGSIGDVLSHPGSVVLSKAMADKYFHGEDPVGKTITIKTDTACTYQVTGVAANAPSNSSIKFNFIASVEGFQATKEASKYVGDPEIGPGSYNLYLKLKHPGDTATLRRSLDAAMMAAMARLKTGDQTKFGFTSMEQIHLGGFDNAPSLKYLKIFPLVAGLILLLALVNYMSLSTARATLRAKEVGVRKVSGASRKEIAVQFYVESLLYTVLAFGLGYLLCYLVTPKFLSLLQLNIDNTFLYSPLVLALLLGLLLLTVLIAGCYPSLVLSAFNPVVTLKGKMSKQAGGVTARKVFTTLQFTIAVALIICGVVIDRQLYFFRHADTGVSRENVVMIPVSNAFGRNYPAFVHDIQSIAGVSTVATSHYAMFKGFDMYFVDGKAKGQTIGLASLIADENYINTLGLKWKYPPVPHVQLADRKKIVINESALETLHLTGNPVGSFVSLDKDRLEIAGVLRDFNFASMESKILPMSLNIMNDTDKYYSKFGCNLFAKIKPHTNLPTVLAAIQGYYKKYDADTPFSFTFMDDAFNAQYKAEDRLASIFSVFTAITIVLAVMGLFGLAAFSIQQRIKEIGIRKILGATTVSVNSLFAMDFLKLVVLSVIIASPVAWWAMNNWLQGFAYRVTIPWWAFACAGLLAVVTSMLTVSYHAVRAAMGNPVESLRSE